MFRRILLIPALLVSMLTLANPVQAQTTPPSLRILLTNDDGYASTYTQALRTALIAAGHQVTIVAPAADASAVGTSINIRFGTTLTASQVSPGVWSVAGSPADAVAFGVNTVFAGNPPDLVVSGPNPGENVASLANHSGTVGAAVTALAAGLPSIALSVARDGSAFPTMTQATAFAVKLVNRLAVTQQNGRLLPPHTGLNVNYPIVTTGQVKTASLGLSLPISTAYAPATDVCPTCFRILPVFATTPDPDNNSDRTLLTAGNVTITAIDGSWEAGPVATSLVRARVHSLTP
ncbi:5'/3'-nucleotidase SurE [Acrocarpospora sp. B8E8]|uniref:5'/3'-nucleotidase SurE n=1 Tax=Acrocarpospora sp. B8E8 TaxID=3153572 RepID=UPI00325CB125